jgi:hypothetical protein
MIEIIKIEESNIDEWMKPELKILQDKGFVFRREFKIYKRKNSVFKKYTGSITVKYKGKVYYPYQLLMIKWLFQH